MQHTHIFATWDFQKPSSYMFYGGNVVLVQLFFSLIFTLVAASISHFRYKIFMLFFNKKCLLCFLSLALALCCFFSRWASLACLLLSLFLCLSLVLYSKFVVMTIYLRSILKTIGITDTSSDPLSVFAFIRHFHISHNTCYLPKKFCVSIVSNLSGDGCNTQEKWKTKVMKKIWGAN